MPHRAPIDALPLLRDLSRFWKRRTITADSLVMRLSHQVRHRDSVCVGSMSGGGDAQYMIDLLSEARSRPFRGQLRASSPDTGPGIQDFQDQECTFY